MIMLSVLSSCMDAFLFGISFGLQKISLTWKEALISSLFPFFFGLGAMNLGNFIGSNINETQTNSVAVIVYVILAIYSYHDHHAKEYKEGIWVDCNKDHKITGKEVLFLSLSLSLDTWIIALPLGFRAQNTLLIAAFFGIANFTLLLLGNYLCTWFYKYVPCRTMSFSWVIFILLALLHS